ncbi:Protein phosphatase PP2A regulatory subunit B [Nowakowskiella sp. JEL0078]|nr:Protein phosphatase PP2A regulatory subunit B [Nowakowskiella sp. JEL0078]
MATTAAPNNVNQAPIDPALLGGFPGQAPTIVPYAQQGQAPVAQGVASASLYVGELETSVTEAMLFELFNMIGPVASIRVCRDAITRRSLGYAYVNYHNVADGERALESLNYSMLKGKAIRIMWSQRDPAIRKSGSGNIFIKNLDHTIDNKALHDTFAAFGPILSCKVVTEEGTSKGYGFVHFETQEAADNAIKHVNGMLLNDSIVYVGNHISKKERSSKIEETRAKFTNIYIKNLDEDVTDEELSDMFGVFGEMVSCVVQRDEFGKSKGFGFVNYVDHEHAAKAVDEMHEREINGKQLFVSRAQKKTEREEELRKQYERIREEKLNKYQGVNLYIKNLDDTIDDEKLRQEFSVYGSITSAKIMRDEKTGLSKGFGFVCFSSPDEATKAVTEMNGRMLVTKPIYVALAQRKEVRRAQLATQMAQRSQMRLQQPSGPIPGVAQYPGVYMPQQFPGQANRGGGVFFQQPLVPRPRHWAPQPGQPQTQQQIQPGFPGGQPGVMSPYGGVSPLSQQPRPQRQPRPTGPPTARPPNVLPGAQLQASAPSGVPAGRGRGTFKYTTNVRNAPTGAPGSGPIIPGNQIAGKPILTAASLAALPPDQQKRTLGESLFPLILAQSPALAGKVTGMLLEMDNGELLHLLESQEALGQKVAEAVAVLEEHMRQQEQ